MDQINPYERCDDYYFDSYGHFNIHEEMLKDEIRTKAYMKALIDNPQLFDQKIVLDLGSGTAVLSMFAVKAGAKHVYAVERANVSKFSKKLIEENDMSDKITVFHGMIEEIQLPSKVDIIVSEWMGYFLVYEAMLDSVLWARDKWLKEGGLIFPNKANIYLALLEDQKFLKGRLQYWDNVYGLSMKSMKKWILEEPTIDGISKSHVVSKQQAILSLDLQTCKVADTNFQSNFSLTVLKDTVINGFIGWFDVLFTHGKFRSISTSPFLKSTHWKQTAFYMKEGFKVLQGETVSGTIKVVKGKQNFRELQIEIEVVHNERKTKQFYRMT